MANINDRDLISYEPKTVEAVQTASTQVQQTNIPSSDETPLFEETSSSDGTISTTDRTDAFIPSTTKAQETKSAEMSALEGQLSTKETSLSDIDSKIEANNVLKEQRKTTYEATATTVSNALTAYNTAMRNYTAAQNELKNLKSNILNSILNTITSKISQAEKKVAELKNKAEKARKEYENAVKERSEAREEYAAAIREGLSLKEEKTNIQSELADVEKQIQDLAAQEAKQAADEAQEAEELNKSETEVGNEGEIADAGEEACEGQETTEDGTGVQETTEEKTDATAENTQGSLAILQEAAKNNPELQAALDLLGENVTEADLEELSVTFGVDIGTEGSADLPKEGTTTTEDSSGADEKDKTTRPAKPDTSYGEDLKLLEELQDEAIQEAEEFTKHSDRFETDWGDVDRLVELFCGELSYGEIQHLGLELLDMVDEASKMLETKYTATVYSKSGAMATSDSATTEEHAEAQADFTEAVLQVSDIINDNDVEFFNVSDKSNFELASHTLDRINEGEYIKTDTLEKQTSAVKNIRVADKTTGGSTSTNDKKYEQYSDAILSELSNLISDSKNELTEEEYNTIRTNFELKSTMDMKSAFDYLKDEAKKYNITSAVDEYGS